MRLPRAGSQLFRAGRVQRGSGRPFLCRRLMAGMATRRASQWVVRASILAADVPVGRVQQLRRRSSPVRMVLLAPTLAPAGGLCRWSRELVRSLETVTTPDELTIDVLVRSRMDYGLEAIEEFGLRCRLHELPAGGVSVADRLSSVRRVGRLMRSLDPDVVHTPLSWLRLLADRRFARPKIVATAHAAPSRETVHVQDRLLARVLAARKRITLATSAPSLRADLDRTVGLRPGTAISMPVATDPIDIERAGKDPADLRGALGIRPKESIVLTLSRLVAGKRVDLVLDVIDLARRDGRPIRFVICGDGPEFGPLVEEAQRRELDGWVHFLKHVPDPGRMLLECDAALNPSDSEGGMPFALIEALLAGTPVVATDAGGVVDLLADPRDGCLVPKGDAAALYEGLCATLDLPLDREERAVRAEGRFGLEQMGRAHLALIEQLVG